MQRRRPLPFLLPGNYQEIIIYRRPSHGSSTEVRSNLLVNVSLHSSTYSIHTYFSTSRTVSTAFLVARSSARRIQRRFFDRKLEFENFFSFKTQFASNKRSSSNYLIDILIDAYVADINYRYCVHFNCNMIIWIFCIVSKF